MIVREESVGNDRLMIIKNPEGTYNIVRLVGDDKNQSSIQSHLTYYDAEDIFEYYLEVSK